MAFQFPCSQCGAHIEVDDEFRDQKVTCPYCRKPTIAAEHVATATGESVEQAGETPMPNGPIDQPRKATILGWLALACIVVGLAMAIYSKAQAAPLFVGLDPRTMSEEELRQETQKRMAARPDLVIMGTLGACILPIAGIVLAIICLARRIPPRWPAVVALCILGGLFALGPILQLVQGSPPAASGGG